MTTSTPQWATADEIADHLRISRGQVDRLRERGMPSVKLGTARNAMRRYDIGAVDRWINDNGIDPARDAA